MVSVSQIAGVSRANLERVLNNQTTGYVDGIDSIEERADGTYRAVADPQPPLSFPDADPDDWEPVDAIVVPATEQFGAFGGRVYDDSIPSDVSDLDTSQIADPEVIDSINSERAAERLPELLAAGDVTAGATGGFTDALEAIASGVSGDRLFTTNAPGNEAAERSITVYESEDYENIVGSVLVGDEDGLDSVLGSLVGTLREAGPEAVPAGDSFGDGAEAIEEARSDSRTRRSLREQLDQTLEAEGYDPEAWNTDARADGTLILQDPETNRTRTIEAGDDLDTTVDSFGGDSDVQPESDDGSRQSGSGGDGLDRRAIGAAAIVAAAAAYGVTQR